MYTINIIYLDKDEYIHLHHIEGDGYLDYQDLLDAPVMIRRIMKEGLVFGREIDGLITRSGYIIPPGRVLKISWGDDREGRDE